MAGAEGDGVPEAACGALVAARAHHQGASGDHHIIIINILFITLTCKS